ncbi:hypothetical protein BJF79_44655 [Actinomadura sp. CNU-125]|nr:hypothetical protein BJF79_44655 [Actinomadura sp. CNU-125]
MRARRPIAARSTPCPTNVMTGWFSTSRKSAERTWASRSSLRVSMEAIRISASADESSGSSPISTSPPKSVNEPRTVVIRCRTVNVISECTGSTVQRPASRSVTSAPMDPPK